MIKGKFAATIEIDIAVDENTPGLLPFEKIKEIVFTKRLGQVITPIRSER